MRTHIKTGFLSLLLVVFLFLVCLVPDARGQGSIPSPPALQDIPILQLNQPLTGNLKDGESHLYKLQLQPGMFARVVVTRRGVDVLMRALDGQNKRLARAGDSFGRWERSCRAFLYYRCYEVSTASGSDRVTTLSMTRSGGRDPVATALGIDLIM